MWAWFLAACREPDPWAGAPDPDPIVRTEHWALSIAGRPIGIEERRFGAGREVARRRALSVTDGRRSEILRSASRVRCGAQEEPCAFVLWDPGLPDRAGQGRFALPEVWMPARSGPIAVLATDAEGEPEIVASELVSDGATARWSTPSGPVTADLDAAGAVLRVVSGRFVAERVEVRPADPEPVDVARLLSVPAPAFPRARAAHVGIFEIDGVEHRVEAPTRIELPAAEADLVARLVDEVAEQIRDGWAPGRVAGRDGDCTEHAVALVERAREAGLEARTAAGRVYAEGPDGPALVLHAWAEVRMGGRWVAADPALRQFPADASHLRLGAWIPEIVARDPEHLALRALK